ncbi:I/LWEQ domain-containing protein [Entophlyctis helioformis]|nr:I/LWEQ domain-containing protein [Entophlyctis helioformis]
MGSRYGGGYAVEKYEEELAQAIKKALSPDEAAPKQKHVRSCILYTWDVKGAGSFWAAIKTYPMVGDEIVSFKALVTIHKVIRQGHPQVGYGGLITAYVTYLQTKLQFHAIHPEFSGTFDYEEYVSLRGIDDPNEGYETISELLLLLDKIDAFSKLIFGAVRSMGSSEARVSALVPLVEESHGIYLFIVSMMSAMHQIIGSVEVLAPLREQFKRNHYALVKFYDECSMLKYLTALVTIPKISADAPDFLSQGAPTQQPKKNTNNNNNAANAARKKQEEDEAFMRQQEEMQRKFLEEQEQLERQQAEMERLRQAELARQQEMLRQQELLRQQEQERVRMQMQAQEQQMINSRLLDAHSQLEYFRNQSAQDRNMIEQYSQRVGQLEQQLAQMSLTSSANAGKDDIIKRLQDEIAQWKQKYESLAKLYAQLRKEHLDLLNKFKTIKDAGTKATDEVRREVVRLEAELKAKANELTEALEELARLRREIQESKAALNDISSTKGAEVQALVARFTNEQTQLENIIRAKQAEAEEMRRRLDDLLITLERNKAASDEEVAVLQAGLDQALLVLSQQQKESQMGLVTRDDEITKLRNEHRKLLYQMMDNVLNACSTTVMEAVYELDSAAHEGNQTASPEHVLSLMEKAQQNCSEFSASFVRLVNGADPKDAINTSSALAQSVSQLLHNGKGVVRLAPNDADAEDTMRSLRMGADATIDFFNQLKSTALALIASDQQAVRIVELSRATQHHVGRVGPIVEKLSQSKLQGTLEGDLGDAVERELGNAARAIDEATRRMQELLARSGPDLNVHSAILQAALAITTAIANLIRCATASQQEIVAHGKGSTTKGAFYKKNNKWTEGLVSAAQSVAVATTYLVEVADGLVQGTHSLEQLAVAAQEVSVATTQLVAAARVKAVPLSKTHDRLEEAASAVREATKLLVRAAKDAAKLSAESRARGEISQMSKHEAKIREMQQQVRILELEKELSTARFQLGEMRRQGYHEDE